MTEDWEAKLIQRGDAALSLLKAAKAIDSELPIRPVSGPAEAFFWVRCDRWSAGVFSENTELTSAN